MWLEISPPFLHEEKYSLRPFLEEHFTKITGTKKSLWSNKFV